MNGTPPAPRVARRAGPADAAELTRLRGLMFSSHGGRIDVPGWAERCTAEIARRLGAEPETFAAFVVDDPAVPGRLLSGGVGWIEVHLPSPRNVSGRRGHIASMSTDPAARRRGLARQVVDALLAYFAERDVGRVDLSATPDGEPLYRAVGFLPSAPALSWYAADGARPPWA